METLKLIRERSQIQRSKPEAAEADDKQSEIMPRNRHLWEGDESQIYITSTETNADKNADKNPPVVIPVEIEVVDVVVTNS